MITPSEWGPHGWKFLHYITLGYPIKPTNEQKQNYKNFFISIKNILPCSLCAKHYSDNLDKFPLTDEIMNDREKLIKWLIDIHNEVNKSRDKSIIDYTNAMKLIGTDKQCIEPIEHFTESNTIQSPSQPNQTQSNQHSDSHSKNNIKIVYGLIGLLVSLVFIALIYKKT